MANKIIQRRIILLITLVMTIFYFSPTLFSCGPVFRTAIFSYSAHPDLPLDGFARGEIGILKPEYARSYLVVAYRYLNNEKLSPKEQEAALSLWYNRLGSTVLSPESKKQLDFDTNSNIDSEDSQPTDDVGLTNWLMARKLVLPSEEDKYLSVSKDISTDNYFIGYVNCYDDAFNTAANTLKEKVKTLGATNPEVKEWLAAQDQVFTNCSETTPMIPPPAKANSSPQAKADRDYQIAAAKFYSGQFDEAANLFRAISQDKTSAWQKVAPLLVARCQVRKAMLSLPADKSTPLQGYFDRSVLLQAQKELKEVLKTAELKDYHSSANRLLRYADFRLEPGKKLTEFANQLTKANTQEFEQDLDDYTNLLDKLADDPYAFELPKNKIVNKLPEILGKQDLTDWLLNFQLNDEKALNYALEKWSEKKTLPWLVSTITKINGKHQKVSQILDAAQKIDPNSPAFASITFHKVRLLIEMEKRAEANLEVDKALAKDWPTSTKNSFYSQKMLFANNLEEFLKYAQRSAAGQGYFYDDREIPEDEESVDENGKPLPKKDNAVLFDEDSTKIINKHFSLAMMNQAASNKSLAKNLHNRLVVATWVRALLLDNEEIGRNSANELIKIYPEMKEDLNSYLKAISPAARKFAGLFAVLKYPALRPVVDANVERETNFSEIDSFRDNWWCSFDPKEAADSVYSRVLRDVEGNIKEEKIDLPNFLDKTLLTQAETEYKKLATLGTAPNYLCNEVINWAKANLSDPRVPQALHLAVRSTRYGCVDKKTLAASKSAFQVLKKNFPNSEWSKKTPYFFGEQ